MRVSRCGEFDSPSTILSISHQTEIVTLAIFCLLIAFAEAGTEISMRSATIAG